MMETGMFEPLTEDEVEARPQVEPRDEWAPIMPAPGDAPPLKKDLINRFAPAGFVLAKGWRYHDGDGRLLGCIVRYEKPANGKPVKTFLPFTFCNGPNGRQEWQSKGFPVPRPLYGLDKLTTRPDAPVLVVEGEKTVDAAADLFPNFVVITSPGGSKAGKTCDWSALAGRDVTIWPDADSGGRDYAGGVAAALCEVGASSVRIVKVPSNFPAKWDLADRLPVGITFGNLEKMLADAPDPNGWPPPQPIVSTLPHVEPFIPEMLPEAMRGYVFDVADRQQAPVDFAAVTAVCGIAAIVGNRVRIAPKQNDDWEVVPNLWGAIIGRPSAMKSPAMQSALGPIYGIQDAMKKTWHDDKKAAKIDEVLSGLDIKEAKKQAEKAIKADDRDKARNILSKLAEDDEEEPSCPRIVVNDATVEKLGELLNENPRGLLLIRDELPGILARLEREENQSERAFYLEAFNGDGQFTYDRIGRGTVHIDNCTLSIIGGVQPSRIAPIVRGAMTGASNDGLIQRLQLAVWPDDIGAWKWVDRYPHREAREVYETAFLELHDMELGNPQHPTVLRFSAAAQDLFRQWMEEIQAEARSGNLPSILESHILKMPKTVASLALLFELIDGGRFEVGEIAIGRALGWADYLRTHANRLYASGDTIAEDGARLIIERRNQLPAEFTVRSVHQKKWAGLADRDAVLCAIEILVETNHCREKDTKETGGRPLVAYRWNPVLADEV